MLQKQIVPIPYQGLQTKMDPKTAPPGTFATIDNMVMTRASELIKRDGFTSVGTSTVPSNITTVYSYMNETGVITNNAFYSYSSSIDQFQLKGQTASPIITSKPIIANTYTQTNCDCGVTTTGILGSIWEDSRGGVRLTVKDTNTDTFLVSDHSISATGIKPKIIGTESSIVFIWAEPSTTSLMVQQYNTIANNFTSAYTLETSLSSAYTYDLVVSLSNVAIVAATTNSSPNVLRGYYWNVSTQAIGGISDGTTSARSLQFSNAGTSPVAISLITDSANSYLSCSVYTSSNTVWIKTTDPYFIPLGSELQVSSATTDPGWAISSCVDSVNNTYIFYTSYNTLTNSYKAVVSSNTSSPTLVSNSSFYLQLGVCSKSFYYSGNAYVILAYASSLQATFFGVRDDGACFGRLFAQLAGGGPSKANCVSNFLALPTETNTYVSALLKTTKIVSSLNSFYSTTSVFTEQIFFTPNDVDTAVLGKFLNISGGYLKQYDGSPTIFEQGFHLYPEVPTLVQSNSTGSLTGSGTYAYLACWEWTDNTGQIHRSEPSVAANITLTGSNNTVTLTVRTLPITNKGSAFTNTRTPVVLAIYRTLTTGTTYYRVNQLPSQYVYNSQSTQTLTYVDGMSDATLGSNSLLYTTGGVFQNISLPSTNLMCVAKNSVLVSGVDTEPNQVFYSKLKEEGVAIEFANEMSFLVDSLGGDITALTAMDDKILIFKKSLVFYIAGTLPDKYGNGTSPLPLLVTSECGCTQPQSIVLTGMGIMFQSQKGIYLIDRQLNLSYIGQSVDVITTNPLNGTSVAQITSAVNVPDKNRVYFTTTTNQVLVYDTFFQDWKTFSLPYTPLSSNNTNGAIFIASSNSLQEQMAGSTSDSGANIISTIETNWIQLNSIGGYGRVFAIMLLGQNANLVHRLKVELYYDYQSGPSEQLSTIPSSLSTTTWGSDTTWGSGHIYGGIFDGTYQFMIKPKKQKCTAIRIKIIDEFPTGITSQSFKFSGISLVVGAYPTWNKNLPYTRRLT